MKKILIPLVAGGLVLILTATTGIAHASKPTVVGKDARGDFGTEQGDTGTPTDEVKGTALAAFGDAAGLDIVSASVGMKGAKTLLFTIKVTDLPDMGGTPEAGRYIWSAEVDRRYFELDGKFTNFTRGACDPTAGSCPPPRNPGMAPFSVRGDCVTDSTTQVTTCKELGLVSATFDAKKNTISIPVPLKLIRAKRGSEIAPGTSSFTSQAGGNLLAITSGFVARSDFPRDAVQLKKTYEIPR